MPAHALETSPNALRVEDSKEGNALLGAEEASIQAGEVYKTIVLLWGNLAVHGQVDEVVVLSGKVTFFPGAKLNQSLVMMGGAFETMPGAQVSQDKVSLRSPGILWRILRSGGNIWRDHIGWVAKAAGLAITLGIFWLLGLLFFKVFPKLRALTADRLAQEWPQNLIAGLLGSTIVPVLGVLLVISLIGILALPIYLLLLIIAGVISYLAAAMWAGHRLLPPKAGRGINHLGFFFGLSALQLCWFVGGWAVLPVLLLWTLGWGSLVRSLRGLWR
ncbi:MAG: hypothetical protein EOP11_02825 [Proteobacteria bacterium]|nr:MAG: hypothetical protein EOP11_02825 [Pseudomonadota bacterium]